MHSRSFSFLLALFLTIALDAASGAALTVEEAYELIPQRQTTYDPAQSTLSAAESQYLNQLFTLLDRAVVQRTLCLQWFGSNGVDGESFANYERQTEQIIQEMDMLPTPVRLRPVQNKLAEALNGQKEFFTLWHKAKTGGNGADFAGRARRKPHPELTGASANIRAAFQTIRKELADESKHNQQAFHDHLSALALVIIR